MSCGRARPARQFAPHGIEPEGRYLQHSDGSWSVVGADGWPVPMDEYLAQQRELAADVSALESLGVTVIHAELLTSREITCGPPDSEREGPKK